MQQDDRITGLRNQRRPNGITARKRNNDSLPWYWVGGILQGERHWRRVEYQRHSNDDCLFDVGNHDWDSRCVHTATERTDITKVQVPLPYKFSKSQLRV